jgi:hypothetical protein
MRAYYIVSVVPPGIFYRGLKPSRNRVVVPARQDTYAGGIDFLELIPGAS